MDVAVTLATEDQDMTIRPGDVLVGDLNGVVVVPRESVAEVVEVAGRQVEADARMLVEIRKGMSLGEASRKFRG